MLIGRSDDPQNPCRVAASKPCFRLGVDRGTHLGQRPRAAANRPDTRPQPNQNSFPLHPLHQRGRPHTPFKPALVSDLLPYARVPRAHSDAQVAQIAASIREFGFTDPILVDGEHRVIAGHGRLLAARKLGMMELPTLELSHLTPAQRRAYALVDNPMAWNMTQPSAIVRGCLRLSAPGRR